MYEVYVPFYRQVMYESSTVKHGYQRRITAQLESAAKFQLCLKLVCLHLLGAFVTKSWMMFLFLKMIPS